MMMNCPTFDPPIIRSHPDPKAKKAGNKKRKPFYRNLPKYRKP